jgi:hypothetical protein
MDAPGREEAMVAMTGEGGFGELSAVVSSAGESRMKGGVKIAVVCIS